MSAPSAPDPTSGRGSCVRPSSDADGGLQLDRSLPYERRPSSAARPQDDAWKTPDASRRPSLVKTPDAGMPHPEVPPYCDSGSRPSTSTQDPCATAAPSLAFQNATAASEPPACVSAAARLWRWLGKHLSPEEPSEADLQDVGIAMRALRQHQPGLQADTYAEENSRAGNMLQQRPVILPTRSAEIAFVAISCVGQGLFSHYLGNAMVLQKLLLERFNMPNSQAPWLSGAYSLSNGVMVVVAGALADMYGARIMILSALLWLTFSSVLGAIIANNNGIVYLIIRAFLGLGVAGMTSASISYLGRIYKPGRRKNIVFSIMGGMGPTGYLTGGVLAGAFQHHLAWISGVNAIITGVLFFIALRFAPTERVVRRFEPLSGAKPHPQRKFDFPGAILAVSSVGLIVFGLTQGSSAHWAPYCYATVIAGFVLLPVFVYVESKVRDPIVPNGLWKVKGFSSLSAVFFMSIGSFTSFQFYAIQFWLRFQGADGMQAALFLIPNFVAGILATFSVGRLFHLLPGHFIFSVGCFTSALGSAFFLCNNPSTSYYALSMPGIFISTFTPDLTFAAASIFITSNVSRRYQGVAGSALVTLQNISQAIMTSLSETVGTSVQENNYPVLSLTLKPEYRHVGLNGTSWIGPGGHREYGSSQGTTMETLQAIWWFDLAGALFALILAVTQLRIPKQEEREHLE